MAPGEVPAANATGVQPGRVRVGDDGVRAVVWLSGEHDLATKDAVMAALAEAVAAEADVVVDLTDVGFMDASIVGVVVLGRRLVADRGRRLTLRRPQGVAQRVIEVCGLTGLLEDPVHAAPAKPAVPSALETWVEVPAAGCRSQGHKPGRRVSDDRDRYAR